MASKKEIKKHLKIALKEIGLIEPWFDKDYKTWVFSHLAYPVEYSGDTKEEVINNYPLYLYDFIEERLNDNLSPFTEKKTTGRGGKREGAGRPEETKKGDDKTRYPPNRYRKLDHIPCYYLAPPCPKAAIKREFHSSLKKLLISLRVI